MCYFFTQQVLDGRRKDKDKINLLFIRFTHGHTDANQNCPLMAIQPILRSITSIAHLKLHNSIKNLGGYTVTCK